MGLKHSPTVAFSIQWPGLMGLQTLPSSYSVLMVSILEIRIGATRHTCEDGFGCEDGLGWEGDFWGEPERAFYLVCRDQKYSENRVKIPWDWIYRSPEIRHFPP